MTASKRKGASSESLAPSSGSSRPSFEIGGRTVKAGQRRRIEIPLARLPATELTLSLSVEVLHGHKPGPALWLSAALHGDELNGIEVIRRVLGRLDPRSLTGSVLAVPIVNTFGFIEQSRYLPDRRDLNRSFPGSKRGSLAAQLAHVFLEEVVRPCDFGIDLHTGSDHRENWPQIRADLDDPETRRCAEAFDAALTIHAQTRDGSLRDAASRLGKCVLLYEAGEPFRFNEGPIRRGVRGVLRVLGELGMIEQKRSPSKCAYPPVRETKWLRARASGLFRTEAHLGDRVAKSEVVGYIGDGFGDLEVKVRPRFDGVVIGRANNPLVRRGDGILHIATAFEEEVREA